MNRLRIATAAFLALALTAFAGCDFLTSPETRVARAEERIERGEYRSAVFELRKLLEREPGHARARLLLAEAEFGSGELEAAEADLNRALESGVAASDAASLKARLQLAFGRHEVLLTQMEAGELALPEPLASVVRGRALLGLRRTAEAVAAFEAALSRAPGEIDARIGIAEARAQSGDIGGALAALEEITREDPAEARAWLVRGTLLLQLGRFEESNEALAQALQHGRGRLDDPMQLQALAGQVDALIAAGRLDEATARQSELERRAARAPVTRLLKARLAIARDEWSESVKLLTELVNELPQFAPARFMLGSALLAQGNLYQAERQLAAVVERDPRHLEARKRLAEVRLRMNRPEAAIDLLGAAIGEGGADPRAIALLGAAQLGAGADPSAIRELEEAVERSPENRAARLDLAGLYIATGNAGRAVDLLRAMPESREDARREFLLVRALAASRGEAQARAEIARMVEQATQDVERLNLAAGFYLSFGDVAAATATLEQAQSVAPAHVPTLVNLGRARAASDRLDEAEALFRRALSHDGSSVDARVGMAEIAGRRGRGEEAIRWLEEIRSDDARAVASRLLLARLYLSGRETAKASKVLAEALAAAPQRTDILIAAGMLQQEFGHHQQALGYYRKAADLEPQNALHWLQLAQAQTALGYGPAARESVDRALSLDPRSIPAVALAARLDLADGRPEAALARAAALRRALPQDAATALLEGDVLAQVGRHRDAARAYEEAWGMGRSLPAAIRLAQARQQAGLADPRAALRDWLREHPQDLAARGMHAILLDQAGQAEAAIAEYERVLGAGPPDAVMSNNLAVRYQERGDPRAEALARQAYRLAPTNAAIADTLGWILVKKGSRDEGLRFLREAVAQAPQEPEILLHLGEALVEAGQSGEAREVLGRLLAEHPEFAQRERALALQRAAGG